MGANFQPETVMQFLSIRFNLTVVRHGQTEANATGKVQGHSNTPLTELGVNQALALANYFKSNGQMFDRIYCSDLGRARHTARIIASISGRSDIVVQEDVRLRERKYGPRFEDKPIADLKKEAGEKGFEGGRFTLYVPDGSESMGDVSNRVRDFCYQTLVADSQQDEQVLIVSHWATIKELLRLFQPKSAGAIGIGHLLETPNTAFSRFSIHCKQESGEKTSEPDQDSGVNKGSVKELAMVQVICLHQTVHISKAEVTVSSSK